MVTTPPILSLATAHAVVDNIKTILTPSTPTSHTTGHGSNDSFSRDGSKGKPSFERMTEHGSDLPDDVSDALKVLHEHHDEKSKGDGGSVGQGAAKPPPKWSSDISEKDWNRMNQVQSLDPSNDDQKHLLYTMGVEAEDKLLGRSNHDKDTGSGGTQADLFVAFKNAQAIHPKQSVGEWLEWQANRGVSVDELNKFANNLGIKVHSVDTSGTGYAFDGADAHKKDPEIGTKGYLDKAYGLPGPHAKGNTEGYDNYLKDPHSQPHKNGNWKDPKQFHLFPDGNVSVTDINQHGVGDCYLLATLGSMAETNPNLIKNGIKDNKDGTYKVRMYDPSGKEIWVGVDNKMDNGNHSTGKHGVANWSSLYEKAYEKYNSVYFADGNATKTGAGGVNNGGVSGNVMKAFTGADSTYVDMHEKAGHKTEGKGKDKQEYSWDKTDGEQVGKDIEKAVKEGRPVTCGTANHHHVNGGVELVGNHEYTVTKAYQKDDKWYVQIRNPWGHNVTDLTEMVSKKDNGYVTLSMDDFISCADGYTISNHAAYTDTGANPHAWAQGNGAGDGDG
jgi:hypothetical protein